MQVDIDKVDPITGELVRTKDLVVGTFGVRLGMIGGRGELTIAVPLSGEHGFTVPPGKNLIVKLVNGDTLHYAHINTSTPTTQMHRAGTATVSASVVTTYMMTYHVDERFYALLSEHDVELFRILLNGNPIDAVVGKKDGQRIRKFSECLK